MAFSSPEGKLFFTEWFKTFSPEKTLDIGAGAGEYGRLIRKDSPGKRIDAIEIFEPYVERFKLREIYDRVFVSDIRDRDFLMSLDHYDLMIMGDVLEHLTKEEAIQVWRALKQKSTFIWISIPIQKGSVAPWYKSYSQQACEFEENVSERHLYDWDYKELLTELGPFLWQVPYKEVVVLISEGIK